MMDARNNSAQSVPDTIVGQDAINAYISGVTETKIRAAINAQLMLKNESK
ncbi:Uncharacterised protein [uncultured archaeon]|nr:Uncharacterised protein [uncultured archaeon]